MTFKVLLRRAPPSSLREGEGRWREGWASLLLFVLFLKALFKLIYFFICTYYLNVLNFITYLFDRLFYEKWRCEIFAIVWLSDNLGFFFLRLGRSFDILIFWVRPLLFLDWKGCSYYCRVPRRQHFG